MHDSNFKGWRKFAPLRISRDSFPLISSFLFFFFFFFQIIDPGALYFSGRGTFKVVTSLQKQSHGKTMDFDETNLFSKTYYAKQSASFISSSQYFRSLDPTVCKVIATWTNRSITEFMVVFRVVRTGGAVQLLIGIRFYYSLATL